jgi:hypothetical protein
MENNNRCITTNISTDETPIPCNGHYMEWGCILTDSDIVFLGTSAGTSLKDVIIKLIQELANLKAEVELNHP